MGHQLALAENGSDSSLFVAAAGGIGCTEAAGSMEIDLEAFGD